MNDGDVRKQLKQGKIHNQYVIVGDEPLLMDNTVNAIKAALKVDESFDCDTFSASEVAVNEIVGKLYLMPFASTRRLIIVKHLEELDKRVLEKFAQTVNSTGSQNCLVMTYYKDKTRKKYDSTPKQLPELFKKAHQVTFHHDKTLVRQWVAARTKRTQLNLSPELMQYLEDEFSSDITGLKNEFEKIENYLEEAQAMNMIDMQDLAKGLCDFNKYQVANSFLDGKHETLQRFEELRPYLKSIAEMVYALTRRLLSHVQRDGRQRTVIAKMLEQMSEIDRRVKQGSHFGNLMLELLFLTYGPLFRKGAFYG